MLSLSIALLATVLLIAVAFAQTTTPVVVTHHSVPIMLVVAAPGPGQPITVTLVLDVEVAPGGGPGEPATKIKVVPKRSVAAGGASVSNVTIGDIAAANAIVTPEAAPAPAGLFPTPTPALQPTPAPTSNVNEAANLRKGPGTSFDIAGAAQKGDSITVVGRNQAGDWLKLQDGAWIAKFLVDDVPATLPIADAPAP
jgi:hypothetical protein